MSSALVDLLLYEFNHNFGQDCHDICRVLLYDEWSTVKSIKHELKHLTSDRIFEVLQILINFNVVKFNLDGEAIESYQFDVDAGISFMRLPRYLTIINEQFGATSRLICDEFCAFGNLYLSELLKKIEKRFPNNQHWVGDVIEALNQLIRWKVLEISPFHSIKQRSVNPHSLITTVDEIREFVSANAATRPGAKRPHSEMVAASPGHNAWDAQYRISYTRLDALCVNALVVQHVAHNVSRDASVVMKTLIDIYESGSQRSRDDPVSASLLRSTMRLSDSRSMSDERFDDCVYQLSNDSRVSFIDASAANSGMSLVHFSGVGVVQQILLERLRNVVEDIWGRNGLEVFSAILDSPYVEENEFRNSVLISKSKLDVLLPQMLTRGFISRLEVSRTGAYNDELLVSLLHVDLQRLMRNRQRQSHQILHRYAVRRDHDVDKHQPLLQKMYEVSCRDKSFQTVDGDGAIAVVTELDRKTVSTLDKALKKLSAAEIAEDTNLLLLGAVLANTGDNL